MHFLVIRQQPISTSMHSNENMEYFWMKIRVEDSSLNDSVVNQIQLILISNGISPAILLKRRRAYFWMSGTDLS